MWNQPGPVAVPSSMPAAGPASTTLPSYTQQAQAFAAAAENVPRPAVPSVLAIADRQVYVENVEVPPAGYTMARRWMRNEPEVDVESIVGPATSGLLLPRPLELSTEGVQEPPPLVDDVDDYDPEQAVVDLKRHWVRQRRHATALRMKRVDRCRDRLKLVAAANTLAVTQLLAAQQHPGAALQQQQLLQLQQLQAHAKQQGAAQSAAGVSQAPGQQQGTVMLQLPPHAQGASQPAVKLEGGIALDLGEQPNEQQQQLDPAAAAAAAVPAEDVSAATAAAGGAALDAAAAAGAAVDAGDGAAAGLAAPMQDGQVQPNLESLPAADGLAVQSEAQQEQQQVPVDAGSGPQDPDAAAAAATELPAEDMAVDG